MDPGACGTCAGIPDRRRAEQFRCDGAPRRGLGAARRRIFVIEADEYDTAFFDKRAKFVHYRPRTVILNNLEYDHADIYPDVAAIRRQFNQLLRTVPSAGRIVQNGDDDELDGHRGDGLLDAARNVQPVERASRLGRRARARLGRQQSSRVLRRGTAVARGRLAAAGRAQRDECIGGHRRGQPRRRRRRSRAARALGGFRGVKRRMEVRGVVGGITVYDDFAHHPTAIEATLKGLRARLPHARIIAVLEPRSNTMKLGVHRDQLAPALAAGRPDVVLEIAATRLGFGGGGRTAARASQLREHRGWPGRGTGCADESGRPSAGDEQRRLRRAAREIARRITPARSLGADSEFDRAVSAQYRAVPRGRAAAADL